MELLQIYGEPGVPFDTDTAPLNLLIAVRRHRQRLVGLFRSLSETEWNSETRCVGWDGRALAGHLAEGSRFFATTLLAALDGEATRLLEGFDPARSPSQGLAKSENRTSAEALEDLDAANGALCKALDAYEADPRAEDVWAMTAEAPPGHVSARLSLQHCLFDSWLHERDLLIPLGKSPEVHDDELSAVTAYLLAIAGLGSLLSLDPGPKPDEMLTVNFTTHDLAFSVRLGLPTCVSTLTRTTDAQLDAPGPLLLDAMSGRADLVDVIDPNSRAGVVLSGALPFLSPAK